MDEFFALLNKLGGASFGTLLALILFGSWKGEFLWKREVGKIIERYESLIAHEIQEKEYWRDHTFRLTGLTETLAKKTSEKL